MPAAERRAHLLQAAARTILTEGFESLTMESLAERAGVSKGLGYAYFDNAEEVALALFDQEIASMYRQVGDAMDAEAPFDDRVRAAVSTYLDVVVERGALIAILLNRLSGRRLRKSVRARLGPFFKLWTRHIRSALGGSQGDAGVLAAMALSASDSLGRAVGGGRVSRRAAEELCVAFLISGLRGAKRN
ncbi:MAG: TetR/AcrR family transcriptional regulator [Candidatus Binataceae bacterium]